jgi:hypothetical protein
MLAAMLQPAMPPPTIMVLHVPSRVHMGRLMTAPFFPHRLGRDRR